MKRALISLFAALVIASIAPRRAEAFDTGKTYEVFIINGKQKVDTGTLVSELNQYVDANGYEACSYFAKWDGPCGVSSPVQLFFDELVTPGYLDCDINRVTSFPTLIVNSPGYKSSGLDKFQAGQTIQNMILTESAQGSAFGVITFGTNLPYPLIVEPS